MCCEGCGLVQWVGMLAFGTWFRVWGEVSWHRGQGPLFSASWQNRVLKLSFLFVSPLYWPNRRLNQNSYSWRANTNLFTSRQTPPAAHLCCLTCASVCGPVPKRVVTKATKLQEGWQKRQKGGEQITVNVTIFSYSKRFSDMTRARTNALQNNLPLLGIWIILTTKFQKNLNSCLIQNKLCFDWIQQTESK